ncbi:MAG: hypothetical protein GQ575_01170 [Deltaproteobacteria bacterium]|nr:hypothetical protein [Deltaproteobacteria bacterium]
MSNITLSVDDEVIRKVRKIAIDKNTTLTQMVRDFLTSVATRGAAQRMQAVRRLETSFEEFSRDMGKRDWSREELHER